MAPQLPSQESAQCEIIAMRSLANYPKMKKSDKQAAVVSFVFFFFFVFLILNSCCTIDSLEHLQKHQQAHIIMDMVKIL